MPDLGDLRAVCAFGPEAEFAASLFADLTGRVAGLPLHDSADLDLEATSVVVTTTEHLSARLLDAMYPSQPWIDSVPGLVFAADAHELERRVRAIAARQGVHETTVVTELYPSWPIDEWRIGPRHVIGSQASASSIRSALGRGVELLTMFTHSDGFDAMLHEQLALCDAMAVGGRSTARAPCCRLTGRCYRFGTTIEDAVAAGHLLPAHEIRARVVFLCTCNGLLLPDAATDPSWGYMDALLGNSFAAAVVTSWTYLVPQLSEFQLVLQALYRGEPVGRAVAALNRSGNGVRLAVLGDPDACIVPLPVAEIPHSTIPAIGVGESVERDDARFLSAFTYAAAVDSSGELQELAAAAADAVRLFEHAVAKGLAGHDRTGFGDSMRQAVLAFVGGCGTNTFLHWIPLTSDRRRTAHTCEACGGIADLFRFKFRLSAMPSRELLICPSCGIRSDAPAGSQLRVVRQDRTLTLDGPLPENDWAAIVHLGCQDRRLRTNIEWPADASGRPSQRFTPPAPWPPGRLTISIMLVAGTDLSVVTTTGVGDPLAHSAQ